MYYEYNIQVCRYSPDSDVLAVAWQSTWDRTDVHYNTTVQTTRIYIMDKDMQT